MDAAGQGGEVFLYSKAHLRANAPPPEPETLPPIVINCEPPVWLQSLPLSFKKCCFGAPLVLSEIASLGTWGNHGGGQQGRGMKRVMSQIQMLCTTKSCYGADVLTHTGLCCPILWPAQSCSECPTCTAQSSMYRRCLAQLSC